MAERTVSERPLRADARRNRERVLAAARAAFAQDGHDVQMEAIARRAGVGVGTIYRHFPTKQALIEELVRAWLLDVGANVAEALSFADPADGLAAFVRGGAEIMTRHGELIEVLGDPDRRIVESREPEYVAFRASVERLLDRAREAGALRKEVGLVEFAALMRGMAMAVVRGGDHRLYADILLQGLRPPS